MVFMIVNSWIHSNAVIFHGLSEEATAFFCFGVFGTWYHESRRGERVGVCGGLRPQLLLAWYKELGVVIATAVGW